MPAALADFSLDHRRSGLGKARCVRRKMAQGKTKTRARELCGAKGASHHRRRRHRR